MKKSTPNPAVDFYFAKAETWKEELDKLRSIVLATGLDESLKWGCPCYTLEGANIVLIHVFKEYCALLFFKGALMNDSNGILVQQTKNVQAARQVRFTDTREIVQSATVLKAYIYEAIEIEKAGLQVTLKKTAEFSIPDEFKKVLAKDKALKTAFHALTPGRQRAYLLYFGAAKQATTRQSRIEKYKPAILEGRGLNDPE